MSTDTFMCLPCSVGLHEECERLENGRTIIQFGIFNFTTCCCGENDEG